MMLSLRATFISTLTQLKVRNGCWQPYSKPTLTPDKYSSITPPGYTAPHRPHINYFSTLLGPRLDPSLEMPRSKNLHNLPPQNQIIITAPTSLIPSFPPPPPYNLPFTYLIISTTQFLTPTRHCINITHSCSNINMPLN
jgi:hypothetical protein